MRDMMDSQALIGCIPNEKVYAEWCKNK
jgi:hypothetical protein